MGTPRVQFIKGCGCGRTYTASEWKALPLRGVQRVVEDLDACTCGKPDGQHRDGCLGAASNIELRNCPCGSTLAVPEGGAS